MKRTLYEILGVNRDASAEEIAAAYHKRFDELNGRAVGDPSAVTLARESYHTLSDPNRRSAYDASLAGRVPRKPRQDEGAMDERASSLGWVKWIVAIVVLVGLGVWWGKRLVPAPEPPVKVIAVNPVEPAENVAIPPVAPTVAPPPEPVAAPPAGARTAEDVFADVSASVARVNVMDAAGRSIGTGSGIVIDRGTIITNCHVALRGASLNVKIGNEVKPASVQLADEELDLCRLSVPGMSPPAVIIGSVSSLRTGARVYAIGAPAGLELTISDGIVSALREVQGGTVIQTTAPISPGSSGGGLFDMSGRLVGITTFQHRFGQNLNFALPADWIGQMSARAQSSSAPPPAKYRDAAGSVRWQESWVRRRRAGSGGAARRLPSTRFQACAGGAARAGAE